MFNNHTDTGTRLDVIQHRSGLGDQADVSPFAPSTEASPNSVSSSFLTPVIWCILVTETAERFAYYGFRAILVLYFLNALGYKETTAIALYGYHASLCNFTPLVGAYLADAYLGRYRTILVFASIYVVGLAVLAFAAASSSSDQVPWKQIASFAGLFLVGLGTGGIKPCVSAFGADQISCLAHQDSHRDTDVPVSQPFDLQQEHHLNGHELPVDMLDDAIDPEQSNTREHHVRAFFNYFYFCINVGAVASIAVVPLVRSRFGFGCAFGLPCLCMILALGTFVSKRQSYTYQPLNANKGSTGVWTTLRLTWGLLCQQWRSHPWLVRLCPCVLSRHSPTLVATNEADESYHVTSPVDAKWPQSDETTHTTSHRNRQHEQHVEDATQLLRVLPILAMFPIYGCLYDQQGSVWTLQATRMYLPHGVQAEQLNMINPVQIMLLIPLFDRIIYPYMERQSWNISPLKRMSWGMLLTAIAFSVSGLVESAIQRSEAQGLSKVNVGWQLPQITILALGEILLSVTGMEFAYATSPARLKAFVTALYLGTSGIGDGLAGILYSTIFAYMNRATVMHVCAAMMIGNMFLFSFVSRSYEGQETPQETGRPSVQTNASQDVELQSLPGVMT